MRITYNAEEAKGKIQNVKYFLFSSTFQGFREYLSTFRVHTPQPKQNSRLFPGFFQALKKIFQAVRVKYEQETSHQSDKLFTK